MSLKLGDTEIAGLGGGSVKDIDNVTITKNTAEKIQAVATVNQNTATGATNPVYNWVGTLAEYNAQNIETLHPDWICYITDDVSGGDSVYTKAQVDALLAAQAGNNPGFWNSSATRTQITSSNQTAPKNGWLVGSIAYNGENKNVDVVVNQAIVARGNWSPGAMWAAVSVQIPIKAGQIFRYDAYATIQNNDMFFYPNE